MPVSESLEGLKGKLESKGLGVKLRISNNEVG